MSLEGYLEVESLAGGAALELAGLSDTETLLGREPLPLVLVLLLRLPLSLRPSSRKLQQQEGYW